METLLQIQMPSEPRLQAIAKRQHIRILSVPPCDFGVPLKQLYSGATTYQIEKKCNTLAIVTVPPILLFCHVTNTHMDLILEALRKPDMPHCYKAILTPTNQHWTVFQLAQALQEEHAAIVAANKKKGIS